MYVLYYVVCSIIEDYMYDKDSSRSTTLSPIEVNFSHYLFAFNPYIPQVKWHLTHHVRYCKRSVAIDNIMLSNSISGISALSFLHT